MIDISLDNEGDLLLDDYDLKLIDNVDQIAQNLYIRLKFFLGEWFLDINQGIPFYEDIFIKSPNQIAVENIIQDEIIQTQGITEITRFESSFDSINRQYRINFTAIANEQEINLEILIP